MKGTFKKYLCLATTMTNLNLGTRNYTKTTTTTGLPSIVYTNQYYNKNRYNLDLNNLALNNPRVFTPSSSLDFVRITDTEHQMFL